MFNDVVLRDWQAIFLKNGSIFFDKVRNLTMINSSKKLMNWFDEQTEMRFALRKGLEQGYTMALRSSSVLMDFKGIRVKPDDENQDFYGKGTRWYGYKTMLADIVKVTSDGGGRFVACDRNGKKSYLLGLPKILQNEEKYLEKHPDLSDKEIKKIIRKYFVITKK